MTQKFKFTSVLFILLILNSSFCEKILKPVNKHPDTHVVSKVLHSIVDEFLIKKNLPFDVIVLRPITYHASEILTSLLSKNQGTFLYCLSDLLGVPRKTFIRIPAVIFVDTIEDSIKYFLRLGFLRYGNHPVIYIVYIANASYSELENCDVIQGFLNITPKTASIFFYAYFVINEEAFVTIATFEWFGKFCNRAYLSKINTFDKNLQKWTKKLEYHEKFMNYHGCELVMMLPFRTEDEIILFLFGYGRITEDLTRYDIYGLTPEIFVTAAKKHNFKAVYQPTEIQDSMWIESFNTRTISYIKIENEILHEPNVILFVYN